MSIMALIPARGGSKGIPRKNILSIGGKPLLAYSIEHAGQSRYINRIVLSTDDREIASIGSACGAETPFIRPAEFAGDLSPDIDVFRHALKWLREHEQYTPELVVHLRPTGPVRRVEVIDRAIELMLEHPEADALRSVSLSIQTPYKMWRIEDGYLRPLLEVDGIREACSMPRQLLPEVFWQNGYVDIIRPRTILEMDSMVGDTILPFLIEDPIYELDYEEDIPKIEEALKSRHKDHEKTYAGKSPTKRYPV
jgi:N-acylneuraminate cytidylyltransferase